MAALILFGTFGYTLSGHSRGDSEGNAPVSEIGYFNFEPGGTVSGSRKLSSSVSEGEATFVHFDGHYVFNGPSIGNTGKIIPMGVITVQTSDDPDNTWDYSFIVIDEGEIMLTSGGANAMAGIMKRIHAPILTPGGTGSRK